MRRSSAERVLLIYPMKVDDTTGRVGMRMKRVHPVTGQLSYRWATVYDPEMGHMVTSFSLVP